MNTGVMFTHSKYYLPLLRALYVRLQLKITLLETQFKTKKINKLHVICLFIVETC